MKHGMQLKKSAWTWFEITKAENIAHTPIYPTNWSFSSLFLFNDTF